MMHKEAGKLPSAALLSALFWLAKRVLPPNAEDSFLDMNAMTSHDGMTCSCCRCCFFMKDRFVKKSSNGCGKSTDRSPLERMAFWG